jgi:hypothetical protein
VIDLSPDKGLNHIDKYQVTKVKQLLVPGPVAHGDPSSPDGFRQTDLVQLWTDPGGLRTLNAATVFYREAEAKRYLATTMM